MKKLPLLLLVLALAGFALGLIHLFHLRFEAGDNYPPYSSLRSDPLGTKALYESLGTLVSARRHFRPLARLGDGADTTLFYFGAEADSLRFTSTQFKDLETFVRSGGRLVISLFPSFQTAWPGRWPPFGGAGGAGPLPATNPPPAAPPGLGPPPPKDPSAEMRSVAERWTLSFNHATLSRDANRRYQPAIARRKTDSSLPATLRVGSALYFDKLDPAWRVLYARRESTNEYPVLIERPMGRGAVVLSADSYYFSNESLRRDRQAALLAWFVGASPQVIFDETHLGVQENPGIAMLARQYHLEGVFFACLVLAGLFVWKNSASFMPPYEQPLARGRGEEVEGKDSAAGFINLLRRNITPTDLLKVCLEQWNAHLAPARRPPVAKLEAMQKVIDAENRREPAERDPVRTYREFCQILSRPSGVGLARFELQNPQNTTSKNH